MAHVVPTLTTGKLQAAQTPLEQMDDILFKWISGRPMIYTRWIQDLMPDTDEVWELKTADLRIFGWICRPRTFIAVKGGYADDYKKRNSGLYEAAKKSVIQAREELALDEPKIAKGTFDAIV